MHCPQIGKFDSLACSGWYNADRKYLVTGPFISVHAQTQLAGQAAHISSFFYLQGHDAFI
jgi:hypothetical protein